MNSLQEIIIRRVDEGRDKILAIAQYLYEHPEVAMEEYKSAEYICGLLAREGFDVERNIAGMETAFRAVKRNGEGPRVAFIAEYDALPGLGHACGHHLISAMSVGAGIVLAAVLDGHEGEVAVIGTPGEELGEGKPRLLEAGVFEGFSAAMMLHPAPATTVCPHSLCLGGIEFRYSGKPAHAGLSPHEGVNALDAVVLFYNAINAMRQQLRDDARVHGIILEAGSAVNIIPDKSRVRLEIRSKDYDYFHTVVQKVVNCAKAAAIATGCALEYENYEPDCMCLTYDDALVESFKHAMLELGVREDGGGLVSTDMGNVSAVIPSIHPMLKVTENAAELHTKEFCEATQTPFAKEQTIIGAKLLALTGLEALLR